MAKLHLSAKLALPSDAVTQTMVIYGGKGMGKTNLGSVLVEELAKARQRFAVIDPVGVWWGLQLAANGRDAGLDVLILGGKSGDIPIEPHAGAVVADLVADEDVDVVIDISRRADGAMWSIGERIRFVTDYALRLYERQGERRRPIMQVIDEAGRFVPQMIPHGSPDIARCVGAIERLVEEGRNVGIGVCLITQRSARMNKSVSELAECMIAFRTVGPRSVDAVLDWLGDHVEKARWKELVEKLRALPQGEALVVSPGWLNFEGVVPFRRRETFDSSSTPTAADERRTSKRAKRPDLGRYAARMAETVERAKADDPKALKRRIAELEKRPAPAAGPPATSAADAARIRELAGRVRQLEDRNGLLEALRGKSQRAAGAVIDRMKELVATLGVAEKKQTEPTVIAYDGKTGAVTQIAPARVKSAPAAAVAGDRKIPGGAMKILAALAAHGELTPVQIALHTRYSSEGGGFRNLLGFLRTSGFAIDAGDKLAITAAGRELGPFPSLPEPGDPLVAWWMEQEGRAAREAIRVLREAYPDALTAEQIAARNEPKYEAEGGGFRNALGRLRTLAVIEGRKEMRLSPTLLGAQP